MIGISVNSIVSNIFSSLEWFRYLTSCSRSFIFTPFVLLEQQNLLIENFFLFINSNYFWSSDRDRIILFFQNFWEFCVYYFPEHILVCAFTILCVCLKFSRLQKWCSSLYHTNSCSQSLLVCYIHLLYNWLFSLSLSLSFCLSLSLSLCLSYTPTHEVYRCYSSDSYLFKPLILWRYFVIAIQLRSLDFIYIPISRSSRSQFPLVVF